MNKLLVILIFAATCLAFTSIYHWSNGDDPVPIPPSKQRTGDPKKGYTYLTTGDYLKSGIPLSYFKLGFGKASTNYLDRGGENKEIPYDYTAVKAANGEVVVAPNCLQCHAQVFDGMLIIGLGNTMIDFTRSQKLDPKNAAAAEKLLRNVDPHKYEAAEPFLKVVKAVGAKLNTQVRGVNTADRLAALL
jgi:hypothetical protein